MTAQNHFVAKVSSGKIVFLETDYRSDRARFSSPDGTWHAEMTRDTFLAASQDYPGLSREETEELLRVIVDRGLHSWNAPDDPEFRNPYGQANLGH